MITPEQARHLAKQELAKVDLGADPASDRAEAKLKEKQLFKSVVEQYLQARKGTVRETTFREITRYLTKTFKELDRMPLASIQRRHVASILTEYKANTSTAAAMARSVLTTFFGWAIGEGFIDENPVAYTNKPEVGEPRDRVLKDEELAAVWNACGDDEHGKIIRLLILTGARRDEIGGMQWKELDRDKRTWTLPPERAKNNRELKLTLPGLAWDIIESTERREFRDHLFGIGKNGFNNWDTKKNAVQQRSGTTGWRVHDLRRSTATGMANIGILPHIIEAVLNHVSGHKGGVAGIYNRADYAPQVKNALAMWADHIRAITTGAGRKILQFPAESAS